MRAALAVAVIGALAMCVATSAARPRKGGGNSHLGHLADEFAEHWLAVHPHEARRLGFPDQDRELVPVTLALLDSERVWHNDFAHRLEQFERTYDIGALSVDRRADLMLLRARLDRERLELDVVKPFETDPGRHVRPLGESVRALLGPHSICKNLRVIAKHLARVPEVLRAAMVGLRRPSRLAVDDVQPEIAEILDIFRVRIPAAADPCRDSYAAAALAEADSAAAGALEYFGSWLREDLRPLARDFEPIGAEAYARLLRDEAVDTTPLDSIEARVGREVEEMRVRRDVMIASRAGAAADAGRDTARLREALRRRWPSGVRMRHPSRLRAVFASDEAEQAWLDYGSRDLVSEGGAAGSDSALVLAQARQSLRIRARLLAEIRIHARGESPDDAARLLSEHAGLDSAEAGAVARGAALEPGGGVATVEAWQLEALRDEARARRGKRFSAQAFRAAVLEQGPLPPNATREAILRRLGAWPPKGS